MNFEGEFLNLVHSPALLFFAIIFATFILEDPATIATGVLLGKGLISWPFSMAALTIGIYLGDLGLYLIGFGIQKGFFKKKEWKLKPSTFDIVIARFIPGLRTLTFSAAGFFKYPLRKFIVIIFPSSLIWSVLLLLGTNQLVRLFSDLPVWVWTILGIALMGLGHVVKSYFSKSADDTEARL
ncbi:MAG: hypothetical protein K2P81_10470 [Bacteriovoracaceae bacterium]|nr:hypothetical protein [Bacteriovoracaceae bacterium]